MPEQPISTLSLRHVLPPAGADTWVEVRPFVDGRDLLKEFYLDGLGNCRQEWDGPAETWPLTPTQDSGLVIVGEPDCYPGCCGALFVDIRRAGDRVLWSSWKNTSSIHAALPDDLHFDAAQYDAELARAAADLTWEEPMDTVARLLKKTLVDSGWFERWGCVLEQVRSSREEPCGVEVQFTQERRPGDHPRRFGYELPVTWTEPAEDQALRFAAAILAEDPRSTAEQWAD
ncbi:hypothetical protein [Streptomyces sp. NPDC026589]|uniref:hypothetical protein n=1 Tax=Streptomyces sp. NPDC026589 TaxID=3155609 RepID=UPI0033DB4A29